MSLLANGGATGSSSPWSISSSGLESVESGGSSLACGRLKVQVYYLNLMTKLRKVLTSNVLLVGFLTKSSRYRIWLQDFSWDSFTLQIIFVFVGGLCRLKDGIHGFRLIYV